MIRRGGKEGAIHARGRDNAHADAVVVRSVRRSREKPWLPVNPNYVKINAEATLADPDSVFYHDQTLIALRKRYPVFRKGDVRLLEEMDLGRVQTVLTKA